MNLEEILIVLGLAFVIWVGGYRSLAIAFLVVFVIVSMLTASAPIKTKKIKEIEGVKFYGSVDVLEPIVIETRRTPPFRIPSKTYATIQAKGYKDIDREKYSTRLFYPMVKILMALFGRRKKD